MGGSQKVLSLENKEQRRSSNYKMQQRSRRGSKNLERDDKNLLNKSETCKKLKDKIKLKGNCSPKTSNLWARQKESRRTERANNVLATGITVLHLGKKSSLKLLAMLIILLLINLNFLLKVTISLTEVCNQPHFI